MATRTTQTEVCAMWRKKSKEGKSYFDGRLSTDTNTYLKGFINGKKKNPNEPDIRIYLQDGNNLGKEFVSLWQKKSDKTGVVYFTGKASNDAGEFKGKNVVAFVGDHTNEKAPWFKVYLQNEVKQAKNTKTSNKQATPVVEEFEEDLAF